MNMKKNTLMAVFGAVLVACASCSDEVPPIPASELYTREFVKAFGAMSPSQDWNAASRGTVSVTTDVPARVQVSAKIRGKNYLLANYSDVSGTRDIRFDIPKGVKEVTVHCGNESVKTTLGGKVSFANAGRAFFPGDSETDFGQISITSTEESQWRTLPAVDVFTFNRSMPEGGINVFNPEITRDFVFRSHGDIIIYPVFWNTSNTNKLGIAYKDKNGEMQHIPLYSNYKGEYVEGVNLCSYAKYNSDDVLTYEFVKDPYGPNRTIIFDDPEVKAYVGDAPVNNKSFDELSDTDDFVALINYIGRKGMMAIFDAKGIEYESIVEIAGVVPELPNFLTSGAGCSGWFQNNTPVKYIRKGATYSEGTLKGNEANTALLINNRPEYCVFTKGLRVSVPDGMRYGMYIERSDGTKFYSIADYNPDKRVVRNPETGEPIKGDDGQIQFLEDGAFHAATWIGPIYGWRWLSFEDCMTSEENATNVDINDMVFLIENAVEDEPDIEVEDPDDPVGDPIKWLIACEDLGNKDDFDFNDVVYEVEYVAGEKTAKITPLAAGGTLEAYLMRNDEIISREWHSYFGASSNQMVNTNSNGGPGETFTIDVPEDFSISSPAGADGYRDNMGGFHLRVIDNDGKDERTITPPGVGEAPQMILIFQPEGKPWRWPLERHSIGIAFDGFQKWMEDGVFDANTEGGNWSENHNESHVIKR